MNSFVVCCLTLVLLLQSSARAQNRPVTGRNGMVVSAHREASRAGVAILRKGGNVVDAAVAVGFALAVVYPQAGNIGGGGFAVADLKGTGPLALDFRETAPSRASAGMYLDSLGNFTSLKSTLGALSPGVPGTVAGLYELHRKYGRLPWRELLEPAVRLAGEGFRLRQEDADALNQNFPLLSLYRSTRDYFTKGDSTRRFSEGELFRQKDFAATLRIIQKLGKDGFYKGRVAELIAAEVGRGGGILSREDLAAYEPKWREPVACAYRGYRIYSMPPPSSGGWALVSLLKMTEPYRIDTLGFHSSATVHLMSEAMTRVFADRSEYLGDPDFTRVPLAALLDSAFLANRMRTFDPRKAANPADVKPGLASAPEPVHTTHYTVADSTGDMVAITYTLNLGFGSKLAVAGAGFLLNNEMDDFSAKPNTPNSFGLLGGKANGIQPGKRMLSSMAPTIVERDGKPFLALGAPGGPTIITRVFQVIANVIDFGMPAEDAVTALRFHHQWPSEEIEYEPRALEPDVLLNLAARGWKLRPLASWDDGGMDAIVIGTGGLLQGAADPRWGDSAEGY